MRDDNIEMTEEMLDVLLPPAEPLPNHSFTLTIPVAIQNGGTRLILVPNGKGGYIKYRAFDAEFWLRSQSD